MSKLSLQRLNNLPERKVKLMPQLRTLMPPQRSSQELLPRSVLLTEAERPDRMLLRRESKELQQRPRRSSDHLEKKPKLKSQPKVKSRKKPPSSTLQLMVVLKQSLKRPPLQVTPFKLPLAQLRPNLPLSEW